MMTAACRWLAVATALVGLAGCDRGKEERAQAAGEIIEGTVSDSMLQTDQIRSEAPLAPRAAKGKAAPSGKPREAGDPPASAAEDAPTATDAATPAEPAAVPPAGETPAAN